jgi:hypothetical protein
MYQHLLDALDRDMLVIASNVCRKKTQKFSINKKMVNLTSEFSSQASGKKTKKLA